MIPEITLGSPPHPSSPVNYCFDIRILHHASDAIHPSSPTSSTRSPDRHTGSGSRSKDTTRSTQGKHPRPLSQPHIQRVTRLIIHDPSNHSTEEPNHDQGWYLPLHCTPHTGSRGVQTKYDSPASTHLTQTDHTQKSITSQPSFDQTLWYASPPPASSS